MTHTKTSTSAFILLQMCFPNFQLNQKCRGGGDRPASYAYVQAVYLQELNWEAGTSNAGFAGSHLCSGLHEFCLRLTSRVLLFALQQSEAYHMRP